MVQVMDVGVVLFLNVADEGLILVAHRALLKASSICTQYVYIQMTWLYYSMAKWGVYENKKNLNSKIFPSQKTAILLVTA